MPHVHARSRHRVPETSRVTLAHVVHLCERGGLVHHAQLVAVTLRLECGLELGDAVEVIGERMLVATGDHENVVE